MLIIENLTVSYGKNQIITALHVNFELNNIHGLVGLNGAGKTTFLNTLYGFKKKDSGSISINGSDLKRSDIAFFETENFFYSNISGKEYLSLFRSNGEYNLEDWNNIFKLPLARLIESYSSGMKRKLALMGILKQDKSIIILDEPFNGLDIESSRFLSLIITKLKERGKTIIITSHILESLTNICDYIHLLKHRKIQFSKDKQNFSDIGDEIFKEMEAEHRILINKVM